MTGEIASTKSQASPNGSLRLLCCCTVSGCKPRGEGYRHHSDCILWASPSMGTQHANTACVVLVLALRALSCCVCSPSREAVVEEGVAVRMKGGISRITAPEATNGVPSSFFIVTCPSRSCRCQQQASTGSVILTISIGENSIDEACVTVFTCRKKAACRPTGQAFTRRLCAEILLQLSSSSTATAPKQNAGWEPGSILRHSNGTAAP